MTEAVEAITRTVYRSPRAGRCYMTKRAAFQAEARAIIKAKYPDEKAEYEDGRMCYPGSHWSDLPNSDKLYRRVTRMVRTAFENSSARKS